MKGVQMSSNFKTFTGKICNNVNLETLYNHVHKSILVVVYKCGINNIYFFKVQLQTSTNGNMCAHLTFTLSSSGLPGRDFWEEKDCNVCDRGVPLDKIPNKKYLTMKKKKSALMSGYF